MKSQRQRDSRLRVELLGDSDNFLLIPRSRIYAVPSTLLPFEALVLCPHFDARNPDTSCPLSTECRHVHADARGMPPVHAHVNYAWRSLDEVTYTREDAGQEVAVAAPNSDACMDVMDSGYLLHTRALASRRRPLMHCAHYYFNRRCDLGSECRFVHAVFIDPQALLGRRAPAPVQMGRGISQNCAAECPPWSIDDDDTPDEEEDTSPTEACVREPSVTTCGVSPWKSRQQHQPYVLTG